MSSVVCPYLCLSEHQVLNGALPSNDPTKEDSINIPSVQEGGATAVNQTDLAVSQTNSSVKTDPTSLSNSEITTEHSTVKHSEEETPPALPQLQTDSTSVTNVSNNDMTVEKNEKLMSGSTEETSTQVEKTEQHGNKCLDTANIKEEGFAENHMDTESAVATENENMETNEGKGKEEGKVEEGGVVESRVDLEARLADIPQIQAMMKEMGGEDKMFSDHEEEPQAASEGEDGEVS